MAREKGTTEALTAYKMAKRISDRKDNVYDKRIIEDILNCTWMNAVKHYCVGREYRLKR